MPERMSEQAMTPQSDTPLTNELFDRHCEENRHCAESERHHLAVQQVKELLEHARNLELRLSIEITRAGRMEAELDAVWNLLIPGRMNEEKLPPAIYVWLVPSEQVQQQPGSWRIRKWDTAPFPEATHIALPPVPSKEKP